LNLRASAAFIVAASTLLSGVAPALAVTSASPVRVNRCDPVQGQTVVSGGYTPGYYPAGGPYYWRDPYGYRYRQYAMPPTVHTTGSELKIEYVNTTQTPIKEIEFGLVARGSLIAEVRDVGTFSPGAEIKHSFGLNPNVFPIGSGLPQCVPLRITSESGSVWTNPHLPALRKSLYQ
jgi:hypothetical protein